MKIILNVVKTDQQLSVDVQLDSSCYKLFTEAARVFDVWESQLTMYCGNDLLKQSDYSSLLQDGQIIDVIIGERVEVK